MGMIEGDESDGFIVFGVAFLRGTNLYSTGDTIKHKTSEERTVGQGTKRRRKAK